LFDGVIDYRHGKRIDGRMGKTSDVLQQALARAAVTRHATVARGALAALQDVVQHFAPNAAYLVIADDNTMKAAGAAVMARLDGAQAMVLPGAPRLKPDVALARDIAARLPDKNATPIAVGSGVINDLTKYAASLAGRPYIAVPTAASMDGYAASGAALIDNGFKRTFECPPPVAIVADLDVVAAAPREMAGWGYGDLAGKIVAGADWMLADALGVEAINPEPFALVQDNIGDWLGDAAGVGHAEPKAIKHLLAGLLISGFAMQAHKNSRPASGSDHQFAHLWEMERLALNGAPVSHGACVGIGAIAMLALYQWLLRQDLSEIDIDDVIARLPGEQAQRDEVAKAFPGSELADNALRETLAKKSDPQHVRPRLDQLRSAWPALAGEMENKLPQAAALQKMLRQAGAAHQPAAIGVSPQKLKRDYRRARLIRRRYTLLDLLFELGWLDEAIAAQFSPGGFWHRHASEHVNA
jgi:glycerol-1-phosphate dehydrogenase [NAD(P)+]